MKRIDGFGTIDKVASILTKAPSVGRRALNPATYTGIFHTMRELFSATQEARQRGYKPGRFSFNVKGGRC